MEQEIQYCTSADGTRIAFSTLGGGSGVPLVYAMPPPWASVADIARNWLVTESEISQLWAKRAVCFVNPRGSGLSDRDVEDLSLASRAWDLESVVGQLGLDRFALWAHLGNGAVAVAYAAEHPERVSRLILWCCVVRAEDLTDATQFQGLLALADKDWDLFSETMASVILGWSGGEKARRYANLVRESASQETVLATLPILTQMDVSELLPNVRVPTLVLQRRDMVFPSMDVARNLASQIPDARLVVVDGGSSHLGEHTDAIVRATREFLGLTTAEPAAATPAVHGGTAIILFADIANSTALTEELGDAAFREKARSLDIALRAAISRAGGTPIEGKLLGDGVLATFSAAREAIACAAACHDAGRDVGLALHVGIHAGDVIRENDNVFGGAVNVAARISDASEAGETLVSGTVRDLARTSAGVSDAVRVWAVAHPSAP